MLKPFEQKIFKTINEVFKSNFKINEIFLNNFYDPENPLHKKIIEENRVEKRFCSFQGKNSSRFRCADINSVVIVPCKQFEEILKYFKRKILMRRKKVKKVRKENLKKINRKS